MFLILTYFFFPFLMLLFFNSASERVYLPINIMLMTAFLNRVIKRGMVRRDELLLVLYIFGFLLVVGISSLHTGQSPLPNMYFFRNMFFNLFFLPLIMDLEKPQAQRVLKILLAVITFQAVLCFIQYQSPFVSKIFTIETIERDGLAERRLDYGMEGANLVTGTLLSMANVASVLTIFVLFIIVTINRVKVRQYLFLTILGLSAIVLTGVRSPLAALLLVLVFLLAKRKPILTICIGVGMVFLYGFFSEEITVLSQLASSRAFGFENPIFRMAGLLTVFEQSDSSGLLTFGRTIDLVNQYQLLTPFGNSTNLLIGDYDSPTDAFFVLMMIDYGWVIVVLLLLPYIYLLIKVRASCPKNIFSFGALGLLLLLIQTIVDEGLWYNVANFVFVLILGLQIAINKNDEHSHTGLRIG